MLIVMMACNTIKGYKSFSNEDFNLEVSFKKQDPNTKYLYCELKIKNITKDTAKYYNSGVLLIYKSDSLIAYHDSFVSWASPLRIVPNESLSLDIYFEMPVMLSESEFSKMSLTYNKPNLPF